MAASCAVRHDGPVAARETLIRTVEIAAARAWPATETAGADGWLLRHTAGVDRARSSSALPPPGRPVAGREAPLAAIEAWYRERGAVPQIQVSPLEWHAELDARLAARGWTAAYDADVLVAEAAAVPGPSAADPAVALAPGPGADWLAAWAACEERSPASCAAHATAILEPVRPRATYALARTADGEAAAVGLLVRDADLAGIFCMATLPALRRRRAGRAVLRSLAAHARGSGVRTLYLQVLAGNAGAQALYAAHGFSRLHGYAFRRAPGGG